ncbi:MAG: Holliday junction resolvase RuvX [Tepidanaerobacteraceae bacterium]|jgi:putative Holliday junction resolvase|nr:Holliday junction resolvase RuvX [Tepidanaerobacteraceae bacterium]
MRILGLDIGEKKIGVAISDELGFTAQGIGVIARQTLEQDLKQIENLVRQYNIDKIVLGLPRNMNGTFGPQSQLVKSFGELLKRNIKIEISYWDERLTTIEAERSLIEGDMSRKKRRGVIDKIAAVLILQGYLNYRSNVDTD